MKLLRVLAVALSVGVIAPAQAAFIGDYAYSNWNASLNYNDGLTLDFSDLGNTCTGGHCTTGKGDEIIINPAPLPNTPALPDSSLKLDGGQVGSSNWQEFTIIAAFDSLISFDWAYGAGEVRNEQLFKGAFGYVIAGDFIELVIDDLAGASGAIFDLQLTQGQTFSFRLVSNGEADLWAQISNFTVERTVPSPAPLALLGLGLIGMAYARRRQAA